MKILQHFLSHLSLIIFLCSCTFFPAIGGNYNDNKSDYTASKDTKLGIENQIQDNSIQFENRNYKNDIQSTQLYPKEDPLALPIIFLNDQKQLSLHFDVMNGKRQTYSYKFIHCNSDWEPSDLHSSEYIRGYAHGFIEDYSFSFNTLFSYIHYSMDFPNRDISFLKSGNYIVKVYANNNEDDLLLTRRFFVVDKKIGIQPEIKMGTMARYRDLKQEIDFKLQLHNYPIQDPYREIKVVISQNGRWDNSIDDLKPIFVRNNELVYDYEEENLFNGYNEFRYFDTKDLHYSPIYIDRITILNNQTHVFVTPQGSRSHKRYYSQNDINGKRLIKRDNSRDSNNEADYVIAHFTLKYAEELSNTDLYVFGELSDWQYKEEFKMNYDPIEEEYELSVLLKQGYYNYMYAAVPKGKTTGDLSIIEGTHSETENDYYFFVYQRKFGESYDRLIGFTQSNSIRDMK